MDKRILVLGIDLDVVKTAIAVTDGGERVAINLSSSNPQMLAAAAVGTIIRTPDYDTLTITNVLDDTYNYVNTVTGQLKKNLKNVNEIEIYEINLDELTPTAAFVG